jgi:hypothetical protein
MTHLISLTTYHFSNWTEPTTRLVMHQEDEKWYVLKVIRRQRPDPEKI